MLRNASPLRKILQKNHISTKGHLIFSHASAVEITNCCHAA